MFFSETQREIVFTFYYFYKFNNDEEGKQFTVSIPRISTIQNIGNQPIDDNIKSGNEKVCPSLSKLVQVYGLRMRKLHLPYFPRHNTIFHRFIFRTSPFYRLKFKVERFPR